MSKEIIELKKKFLEDVEFHTEAIEATIGRIERDQRFTAFAGFLGELKYSVERLEELHDALLERAEKLSKEVSND